MSTLATLPSARPGSAAALHTVETFTHRHLRVRIAFDARAARAAPLAGVDELCTIVSYGPIVRGAVLGTEQWAETFTPRLPCERCDGTGADLADAPPRVRPRMHSHIAHQSETGAICRACGGWGARRASIVEYVRDLDADVALALRFTEARCRGYSVAVCEHPATEPNGVIYLTQAAFLRRYRAESAKNRANARRALRRVVETYDRWLRGEVFGYVVETAAGARLTEAWGFVMAPNDPRLIDAATNAAEECACAIAA